MLDILLCILISSLSAAFVVLYFSGAYSKEQFKGERSLTWKIVWGIRCWVGNLGTFMVLFMASAVGGRLTFYVHCISLIVGILISAFVHIMLRRLRIPTESSPILGPYRSLVRAPPRAFPKTLPRRIHVFLLNFFRPGWDDTAPSTEKA